VIEDLAQYRCRFALPKANFRSLFVIGHGYMCALGDQRIEPGNLARRQQFSHEREKYIGIVIASFVGDDCQYTSVGRNPKQRLLNDLAQIFR
jgi:hypothetical protein